MPFTIIRQDITKMKVDAIVNAANPQLLQGGGVCGAIFHAAGADRLQEACDKVAPIQTGGAAITPGFDLDAKFIIHAAGPVYYQYSREQSEELLRSAYLSSLGLAQENGCESIAFPLISSGIFGYPKEEALNVATSAITDYLEEHEMDVYLAVFDKSAFVVSGKLMGEVASYIDEHYVESHSSDRSQILYNTPPDWAEMESGRMRAQALHRQAAQESAEKRGGSVHKRADGKSGGLQDKSGKETRAAQNKEPQEKKSWIEKLRGTGVRKDAGGKKESVDSGICEAASRGKEASYSTFQVQAMPMMKEEKEAACEIREQGAAVFSSASMAEQEEGIDDIIFHLDEPFSTTLFRLIDAKGKTDVEVYKRANLDRKLFSKIRSIQGYTPKKQTIIALAVSLELTLAETDELLKCAGYALSHAVKFDVIVEYFIIHGRYDIFEINEVLFKYDQPLLGA